MSSKAAAMIPGTLVVNLPYCWGNNLLCCGIPLLPLKTQLGIPAMGVIKGLIPLWGS